MLRDPEVPANPGRLLPGREGVPKPLGEEERRTRGATQTPEKSTDEMEGDEESRNP